MYFLKEIEKGKTIKEISNDYQIPKLISYSFKRSAFKILNEHKKIRSTYTNKFIISANVQKIYLQNN